MFLKKKLLATALVATAPALFTACDGDDESKYNFARIASFEVCTQVDAFCDTDDETSAEIVAANEDGTTLIYTDSPSENVGFVDITNPAAPVPMGVCELAGEPTSVAIKGNYALVGVNTSENFIDVSGQLDVINIASKEVIHSINLGGQPDSVAISPDGTYAAVVIENERDEDLGEGTPPQAPAGYLVVVDTSETNPADWETMTVDLTGLADLYAGDPEPEYVDINEDNVAVVTLQENNHIVLVDLKDGSIINDFSAGSVNLTNIDLTEGKPLLIDLSESEDNVLREPDGVAWMGNQYFATADEGDLDGGSRGFTIFDTLGNVVWNSGSSMDQQTARLGHYPDKRSGNKGNEPENAEFGTFKGTDYLFVNSERSSLVFVYNANNPLQPEFKQVLPAATAPEGALAIPSRNLLIVASEEDNRGDKLRSAINIYEYAEQESTYPTVQSTEENPIYWGAMSGLSSDSMNGDLLYAVEDSFYQSNRIFTIDVSEKPATITSALRIRDTNDVFAAFPTSGEEESATSFDAVDLSAMINDDKTVNIDPEGIAKAADGGFWVASEGAGTMSDTESRPIEKLNFIFKTDANGIIENVITLPEEVNAIQVRFGFEGITEYDDKLYVAVQRAWGEEENPRIGIYDQTDNSWTFVFYPLDAAESQNGGWVGLSDISTIGNGEFLVLERDNQGGPDAAIKRLYRIDLSEPTAGSTITKTLVRDLMADLAAPGGLTYEKVEGSAVMNNGDVYIINDNDGVDDNSGETQLMNLGNIL